MERRRVAVVVLGLVCSMLLLPQAAWAGPGRDGASATNATSSWTSFFTSLTAVIDAMWEEVEASFLPSAWESLSEEASGEGTTSYVTSGTCENPVKLEHGCGVDPDG